MAEDHIIVRATVSHDDLQAGDYAKLPVEWLDDPAIQNRLAAGIIVRVEEEPVVVEEEPIVEEDEPVAELEPVAIEPVDPIIEELEQVLAADPDADIQVETFE